ncbi:ATP-binding protein [Anoxynatronum sibiricum]|uniref:histidine kinase n=1 Tax=Anoxynatronum sibiricum TaxID=210623 RepID=A0ABU9VWQ0_9CLOT
MKHLKRLVILMLLILLFLILRTIDLHFRYNMNLRDYYTIQHSAIPRDAWPGERPLIVGISNHPPLAYLNENNNTSTGIGVDYLSQLAIEMGTPLHLKILSADHLEQALHDQEVDMVFIERKPVSEKLIAYSQPLCVLHGRVLVTRRSQIQQLDQLCDALLVTLEKDHIKAPFSFLLESCHAPPPMEVENLYQAFALLRNSQAVGLIGNDMEIAHFLHVTNRGSAYTFLDQHLYEKEICIGVLPGNEALLMAVDKGILEMKKKDLISLTQQKWLGDFKSSRFDKKQIERAYQVIIGATILIAFFSIWNYTISQKVSSRTRELSQSKSELRLIIDSLQRGIMLIDANDLIVECNDAITELINTSKENLLGHSYLQVPSLRLFLQKSQQQHVFQLGKKHFTMTSQLLPNKRKLIILEDYTEKFVSERRARQESKMIAIGQLSAGLAHEIRNPLGLIKSYVYVLEKQSAASVKNHALSVINDSVTRINTLIQNLLRFSRLSSDDKRPVNIQGLVDMILALEENRLAEKNVDVTLELPPPSAPVIMNEDVLKLIFHNLLSNSTDAFIDSQQQNQIHIHAVLQGGNLVIKFRDNGQGIDASCLESVFNPFFSTKESGTGLGLYILSTEISKCEGSISVDSSPDAGTEFTIILPVD